MKKIISVISLITVLTLTLSSCAFFVAKKVDAAPYVSVPANAGKSAFYLVESVDGKNLTLVEGKYETTAEETTASGPVEVPVDGEGEITRDADGRGIEMPAEINDAATEKFVTNGVKMTADFSNCKVYKQNGPELIDSSLGELKSNDIVKIAFDNEGRPYSITVV